MKWIECTDQMPEDMEVVIALYCGHWPGRGQSGVVDAYTYKGRWFNIPENVSIAAWIPLLDTNELTQANLNPPSESIENLPLLGTVETEDPSILECIFQGDHSKI